MWPNGICGTGGTQNYISRSINMQTGEQTVTCGTRDLFGNDKHYSLSNYDGLSYSETKANKGCGLSGGRFGGDWSSRYLPSNRFDLRQSMRGMGLGFMGNMMGLPSCGMGSMNPSMMWDYCDPYNRMGPELEINRPGMKYESRRNDWLGDCADLDFASRMFGFNGLGDLAGTIIKGGRNLFK